MVRISSFFLKIFSGYFLIILLLLFLTLFTSFKVIKISYMNNLKTELEKINLAITENAIQSIENQNVDEFVKNIAKKLNIRLTIVDKDGIVLGDSEHDPKQMENHKNRNEIDFALVNKTIGSTLRYSKTLQKEMLYIAQVLEKNNIIIGVIRSSMFVESINETIFDLRSKILKATFLVFLISIIVAIFISRSFSKPVMKLKIAAMNISNGDFSTRVNIRERGDFKTFADSFNEMTEKIQNLFIKVENDKERLNCLLQSIKEGIVVLDSNGIIILSNPEMEKITNTKLIGKEYSQVFEGVFFRNAFSKIQNDEPISLQTVKWNNNDFIFSLSKVDSKGDLIFSLKNISEMKQLEQIKKDFVSNVSHELRTPLTAIKGFVETLQDEETDTTRKYYFEILEKHTDRLINIVKDLLSLSNLESKKSKLDVESINIETLISDVEKVVEMKINAKGLHLHKDIDASVLNMEGDRFKLEQLLINLIDNSAKYTDEGTISIITKKIGSKVRFIIKDTGIGIPSKHLGRIFERFYVVDKSRSRKMGGTGLGLSIVKHIVMQHRGELDVKSEKKVGTEFIIDLSINIL